jgi:Mg2+ and Co2+ transporter CorA
VSPAQETQESEQSGRNGAPVLRHRKSRTNTVWSTYPAVDGNPHRPQWEPGQEPGLDPAKPYGGREEPPSLYTECDITVVDYSEDDMMMRHLDNVSLPNWIAKMEKMEQEGQKEDWVMCRWINVNGLSWDVIQALGKYKRLHRLAIEDMVNTKNRTKVDW